MVGERMADTLERAGEDSYRFGGGLAEGRKEERSGK